MIPLATVALDVLGAGDSASGPPKSPDLAARRRMIPAVARVAGSSVLSLQVFLRKTYGEDVYGRALDALPSDEAEPLRGIVLPVNWYPAPAYIHALKAAREVSGDDKFFERYGAFAAEFQINAFRRFILRFASPVFFLDRAGRMWRRTYDTGEWEVEGGDRFVRGTLRGFTIVDADYCRVLVAWIHRASQLTGTRGHTEHPSCRARGDEACVFEGRWE